MSATSGPFSYGFSEGSYGHDPVAPPTAAGRRVSSVLAAAEGTKRLARRGASAMLSSPAGVALAAAVAAAAMLLAIRPAFVARRGHPDAVDPGRVGIWMGIVFAAVALRDQYARLASCASDLWRTPIL